MPRRENEQSTMLLKRHSAWNTLSESPDVFAYLSGGAADAGNNQGDVAAGGRLPAGPGGASPGELMSKHKR